MSPHLMILAAWTAASLTGTALGTTKFVSLSQSIGGDLSPFHSKIAFSQIGEAATGFPPQQIVINRVSLRLDATVSASITVENDSTVPNNGVGVTLTGSVLAHLGPMSVTTGVFGAALSEPLAPSDGIPGFGPDFYDFGVIGGMGGDLDMQFDGHMPFLGDGDFFVDVQASASIDLVNLGQSTIIIADYAVQGTVTVEIFYTIVPASSAVVPIFSLGALKAARRRRP